MSFLLLNFLTGGGSGGGGSSSGGSSNGFMVILLMVGMVAVMYFTSIRPQKKRQKEEQAMRDNLQIGDEITTIGGIMGRVVTVKEDSIVIETGSDRTKLRVTRTAVGINNTQQDKLDAEREAARKEQEEARSAKLGEAARERKKSKKNREE